MKTNFSITYAERLGSYLQIVKETMPGFFIKWFFFLIIGLLSSCLLIINGIRRGAFETGYWYILLGIINGASFSTMTYKNVNLKRLYSMQIKDQTEWKYEIEIEEDTLRIKTDKSSSLYVKSDIEYVKELESFLYIKTIYGSSIVVPKNKVNREMIDKIKTEYIVKNA